jgi:putative solute:sodium symporter small subunit
MVEDMMVDFKAEVFFGFDTGFWLATTGAITYFIEEFR